MRKRFFLNQLVCVTLIAQISFGIGTFSWAEESGMTSDSSVDVFTQSLSEASGLLLGEATESSSSLANSENESVFEKVETSTTFSSELSEKIIASGSYGTVPWRILDTGVLILETGDFPSVTASAYNQYISPWATYAADITQVEINGDILVSSYGAEGLFFGLTNLQEISHLNRLDFSQAISIAGMFAKSGLYTIDLSGINFVKVQDISFLFFDCVELASINMSELDQYNLKNLTHSFQVFDNTLNLTSLILGEKGYLSEQSYNHTNNQGEIAPWMGENTGKVYSSTVEMLLDTNRIGDTFIRVDSQSEMKAVTKGEGSDYQKNSSSVEASLIDEPLTSEIVFIPGEQYLTILEPNHVLWGNLDFTEKKSEGPTNYLKTVLAKGKYEHPNGYSYYTIYDRNNTWLGYVNAIDVELASGPGGAYLLNAQQFTIIEPNYILWGNLDFTEKKSEGPANYLTNILSKGYYNHFNGYTYYSVYDENDVWLGYMNAIDVEVTGNPGIEYIPGEQYLTILEPNNVLWGNLDFTKKKSEGSINHLTTVLAKGKYNHPNGYSYYTIYGRNNTWLGYVNAIDVELASGPGGAYLLNAQQFTIIEPNYILWGNLDFTEKKSEGATNDLTNILSKGYYNHFNGYTYYSIYDENAVWLGYINAIDVELIGNPGIEYIPGEQYLTILEPNNILWGNLDFTKKKSEGSINHLTTVLAKGKYNHPNGYSYYTIYDRNNTWLGYVNAIDVELATGPGGAYLLDDRQFTIIEPHSVLWGNLDFTEKKSEGSINYLTNVLAKGRYHHFNGYTYYSVYDENNVWLGYLNGIDATPVLARANSKGYLKIPVYNNPNGYQATHPSVLYFKNGWNGYKFWMGYTPYEYSNEMLENPSVAASNDGVNWEVPTGLTNPLEATDTLDMHYSDPHLVFVNGQIEYWYRKKNRGSLRAAEMIVRKCSSDGINWSTEEILYTRNDTGAELLSPVVHYENGKYQIWFSNFYQNKFEYFESTTGTDWEKIREIEFPIHPDGLKPWHMDIVKNGDLYELYYSAGLNDYCTRMSYATSTDNIHYTFVDDFMVNLPNNFDETRIYRPAIVDVEGNRYLYYGGSDSVGKWHIGLTLGTPNQPTSFTGVEFEKE